MGQKTLSRKQQEHLKNHFLLTEREKTLTEAVVPKFAETFRISEDEARRKLYAYALHCRQLSDHELETLDVVTELKEVALFKNL